MLLCITFSKKGWFFLKRKGKSSIQQGRLESNGKLLTPGDVTKKVTDFTKDTVNRHDINIVLSLLAMNILQDEVEDEEKGVMS